MKPLRIGFIGCGRISHKHFEALKHLQDKFEVVATCDLQEERAEVAASYFGAKHFNSLAKMLTSNSLNLVVIATPNGLHPEHAIMCAEYGVDVICEKPMAITYEDGLAIKEAFDKHKRNFFLIHQNRYNDTIVQLKAAIDEGRFGKIYMLTSNVFWHRPQEYYDKEAWHGTKALDGGAFMTQASHYIDMLNWLSQSKATQVYASLATMARDIETEDTGSAIINWENGIIGNVNVTVLTYPKNLEGSVTIIGEKGTVKIGGIAMNEIHTWEFSDATREDYEVKHPHHHDHSVYGHGHYDMYEKVYEFYNGGSSDIVDIDSALNSLRVLAAILESDKTNKPVKLK